MPIKELTDSVRLPRLGKIRLGTRHPEKGYPMKSDHFVLPKDHPDYENLVEIFGAEPKELRVLIPVEDETTYASQYYKAYNQTYGLVCKGDGVTAMRMIDIATGGLPVGGKAGTVKLQEMACTGPECPEYKSKKCHEVMNLCFIIPEVPGLGVWQIDTGSKNSILNINSCAKIIKRAFGRISMIPLKLTFEPQQVNNPDDMKKQTVYVLNLRTDVTLAQLADATKEQSRMLSVGVTLEDAFDVEVEKDIEELWGDEPATVIDPLIEAEKKALARAEKEKEIYPEKGLPEDITIPGGIRPTDLLLIKEQIDTIQANEPERYRELIVWLSQASGDKVISLSNAITSLSAEKQAEFIALLQ